MRKGQRFPFLVDVLKGDSRRRWIPFLLPNFVSRCVLFGYPDSANLRFLFPETSAGKIKAG